MLWILVFSGILFFIQSARQARVGEEEIAYSQFKRLLHSGQIAEVRVREDLIRGRYQTEAGKSSPFKTIPLNDPDLVKDLERAGVERFSGEVERSWVNALLMNALWIGLFFFLWWLIIIRQMQGGGKQALAFGRSRAKLQSGKKQKITFADV
ncbi:MAG: ATP-dependent metallopeptidase FtsH/Yme1/Tma family protein, partial [Elusimicrobia bacterium]|nr:ATP-dependent metallopeptidase FtsH/Yme1/Tma family protein [Elusimicrobiota bacterium]